MISSELKFRLAGRLFSPEMGKAAAERLPGKSLCLLLDSREPSLLQKLSDLRQICKLGMEDFTIIICETSEGSEGEFASFTRSDLSWTGKIRKDQIRDFLRQRHRILIGYSRAEVGAMKFLIQNSEADLKIGRVENVGALYDLEIFSRYEDADVFIKEVEKYLKQLNYI